MKTNTIARKSLTRGAAQARRLNAQRTIAPSVINATTKLVAEQAAKGSIQARHAAIDFQRDQLIIRQGEAFYLVESTKFAGRFYFLTERNSHWVSSSDDERVTAQLVERVQSCQQDLAQAA